MFLLSNPINLLLSFCTIATCAIAIILYRYSKKQSSTKLFVLFIVAVVIWIVTNLVANLALFWGNAQYLFWTKAALIGPTLIPLFLLLFANAFPREKLTVNKVLLSFIILIAVFILVFIPTKYNVESVNIIEPSTLQSTFSPGWLYIVFIVYFAGTILGVLIYLLQKRKQFYALEAAQIKNVIYGIVLTLMVGLLFSAILPLLGHSEYIAVSPVSTVFFVVFTGYAIIRHQLLSTKLIVAETVTYIVVVALIADTLMSHSTIEAVTRIIFVPVLIYGGYVLIRSMRVEIEYRQRLEVLSQQLKLANARLKQVDALKTEFISMASHELLTPISAIEGYLSMIVDEHIVQVTDPKLNKYITNVYTSSKRLARLVSDLLNVSRIEEGRLLVQKSIVNIEDLASAVIEELKFKAQTAQVRMATNYKLSRDKAMVYADADKIKEVVVNLFGNSLKFTKPGGQAIVTVDIWPTNEIVKRYGAMSDRVRRDPNGNGDGAIQQIVNQNYAKMIGDCQVVVSVTDNGVGIAPEDVGRLFQKFSRVGDWSTQAVQGTGLGLYISRALVEMHHGKIWVESAGVGKGSTFFFSLPFAVYAQQIAQLDSAVPKGKDMKGLSRMGE